MYLVDDRSVSRWLYLLQLHRVYEPMQQSRHPRLELLAFNLHSTPHSLLHSIMSLSRFAFYVEISLEHCDFDAKYTPPLYKFHYSPVMGSLSLKYRGY